MIVGSIDDQDGDVRRAAGAGRDGTPGDGRGVGRRRYPRRRRDGTARGEAVGPRGGPAHAVNGADADGPAESAAAAPPPASVSSPARLTVGRMVIVARRMGPGRG